MLYRTLSCRISLATFITRSTIRRARAGDSPRAARIRLQKWQACIEHDSKNTSHSEDKHKKSGSSSPTQMTHAGGSAMEGEWEGADGAIVCRLCATGVLRPAVSAHPDSPPARIRTDTTHLHCAGKECDEFKRTHLYVTTRCQIPNPTGALGWAASWVGCT
ncbi:hypothetical protein BKA93DRAFT_166824 [Sparassis latifolia]